MGSTIRCNALNEFFFTRGEQGLVPLLAGLSNDVPADEAGGEEETSRA